jgi:hypothetical protein
MLEDRCVHGHSRENPVPRRRTGTRLHMFLCGPVHTGGGER